MSAVLYVLPPDGPRSVAKMRALIAMGEDAPALESDVEFFAMWQKAVLNWAAQDPPRGFHVAYWSSYRSRGFVGSQMAEFLLRLEAPFPPPGDFEPLWRPVFGCRAVEVDVDATARRGDQHPRTRIRQLAVEHRLGFYDPDTGELLAARRRGPLRRLLGR